MRRTVGMIAPVLDHRMEPARGPSGGDDLLGMRERIRHRLLGEEMAAATEGGDREVAARRRDHHVENHVGPGAVDDVAGVGPDHGVDEPEFLRPPLRPVDVDVDQPDDRQAVDLPRRFKPSATHSPATDEHSSQHAPSSHSARVCRRSRSFPETLAP